MIVAPTIANKLRQLRSLGLPVAIGSDAGSPMQFQAKAIWWELGAWRAAGVSPRDALVAAAVTSARAGMGWSPGSKSRIQVTYGPVGQAAAAWYSW